MPMHTFLADLTDGADLKRRKIFHLPKGWDLTMVGGVARHCTSVRNTLVMATSCGYAKFWGTPDGQSENVEHTEIVRLCTMVSGVCCSMQRVWGCKYVSAGLVRLVICRIDPKEGLVRLHVNTHEARKNSLRIYS